MALAGCGGNQDALHPASGAERSIADLWWVMLIGSAIGFGSVVLLLFLGWRRRGRKAAPPSNARLETTLVVTLGVGVPVVVLLSLFVYSDVFVMRSTAAPTPGSTQMTIDVIGHDWWWEVRYPGTPRRDRERDPHPGRHGGERRRHDRRRDPQLLGAAAEPEDRPDPGPRRTASCSRPTARAGSAASARSSAASSMPTWRCSSSRSRPPGSAPGSRTRRRLHGRRRPARNGSAPTSSGHRRAPGATRSGAHRRAEPSGPTSRISASRGTLAALTLPNTPPVLRSWITDPDHAKPGVKMPALPLTGSQLDALTAYLGSLR